MKHARRLDSLIQPILFGLRRAPSRGVILLVDRAHPGALPGLLRALLKEHPNAVVLGRALDIEQVPADSVVLLVPRREELAWMNLHRPRFATRRLRVVLWCPEELAAALHFEAPDLFEWITRSVPCPPLPVPYAVAGFRALLRARVVGCRFAGGIEQARDVVTTAFPGRRLRVLSASVPATDLLYAIERGGPDLLCFTEANESFRVQKVRRALAQAGWRRFSVLIDAGAPCPGWWRLDAAPLDFDRACAELGGGRDAGLLAALLGLEPEAIALCGQLLRQGSESRALLAALAEAEDPGAAVARLAAAAGLVDLSAVEDGSASPPALRGLWNHPGVRALRTERRSRAGWHDLAVLAAGLDPLPISVPEGVPEAVEPFAEELRGRVGLARSLPRGVEWRKLSAAAVQFHAGQQRLREGQLRLATVAYERALSLREQALGATHPDTAEMAFELASCHLALAEPRLAEPLLLWAFEVWDSLPGWEMAAAGAQGSLGLLYLAQGQRREAAEALDLALRRAEVVTTRAAQHPCLLGMVARPDLRARLWLMRQLGVLWLRRRFFDEPPLGYRVEPLAGLEELAVQRLRHQPQILYLTARGGTGDFSLPDPADPEALRRIPEELLRDLFALEQAPVSIVLDDLRDAGQVQAVADGAGAVLVLPGSSARAELSLAPLVEVLAGGGSVEAAVGAPDLAADADAVRLVLRRGERAAVRE